MSTFYEKYPKVKKKMTYCQYFFHYHVVRRALKGAAS